MVQSGTEWLSRDSTHGRWRQKIDDRWLSVDEIAYHLGIKQDTVCKMIKILQILPEWGSKADFKDW
jgi:biotin operon repressor